MKTDTWHAEKFMLILITGGFMLHLINVAHDWATGATALRNILLWPVDFCLAAVMIFCTVALITRYRAFQRTFDLSTLARRIGYWSITVYITMSIPGHILFLTTGDTGFFDAFPWWFSLMIMPVYVLILAYFITLKPTSKLTPLL